MSAILLEFYLRGRAIDGGRRGRRALCTGENGCQRGPPWQSERLTANGDDLDAARLALAVALGDDAGELGEREVHDPAVLRVHGLEGDDLTLFDGLLAEAAGHRGERVLAPGAVALGVDDHVTAALAGAVDDAVREELERRERLALLADHPAGVLALDLEADVLRRILFLVFEEVDGAVHSHAREHVDDEVEGRVRAPVFFERGKLGLGLDPIVHRRPDRCGREGRLFYAAIIHGHVLFPFQAWASACRRRLQSSRAPRSSRASWPSPSGNVQRGAAARSRARCS